MPIEDNKPDQNKISGERTEGILLDEKQWLYLKDKYGLTSRELQVAILLCRGFTNERIAKALDIKQGTVKTHLRNLYRRFRVKNKVRMILILIDDVINKFYIPSDAVPHHV